MCPGHERFIHNMLAGAQGIDLVLLVVAADDGVMPQTREHLAIIELLGIPQALVAISKCDRVEPARLPRCRRRLPNCWRPALCGALQFPVSSLSGEGSRRCARPCSAERQVHRRSARGGFRLAVDRVFAVSGAGIVVTGTALAGQVSAGDTLLLGKAGKPVRVRGLHAQNQAALVAEAGQRVALNITGERLAMEQVHRGDWLLPEWLHAPSVRVDIELNLLPGKPAPSNISAVHVHLGTQDVTARVALLEGEKLAPASACSPSCCSMRRCRRCTATAWCCATSAPNARWAAAGCSTRSPRAGNAAVRCVCASCRCCVMPSSWSRPCLRCSPPPAGLDPQRLERQFNRRRETWQLPDHVVVIATRQGQLLFARSNGRHSSNSCWRAWRSSTSRSPTSSAPTVTACAASAPCRWSARRSSACWMSCSVTARSQQRALAALAGSQGSIERGRRGLVARLQPRLLAGDYDPPWVRTLAGELQREEAEVRLLLRKLARLGVVHQVVRDLFYPQAR
jgi:selenocysteine-specific elongation factor